MELEPGWAREAVWTFWCRDKAAVLVGIRNPDRPARSLGTIPTELARIHRKSNRLHLKDKNPLS
jgi:hypothetical protein